MKTYAGCSETLTYAAEALVMLGRHDEALATLDEAQALVDRFGERLWVTESLLVRARALAGRGDAEAARAAIDEALAEARRADAAGAERKALAARAALPSLSAPG